MMQGLYWQTENHRATISYLTKRAILTNLDTDKFLIACEYWDAAVVRTCIDAQISHWSTLSYAVCPSKPLCVHIAALRLADTIEQFGTAFDALLVASEDLPKNSANSNRFRTSDGVRIKELICGLWSENIVALPLEWSRFFNQKIIETSFLENQRLLKVITALIPDKTVEASSRAIKRTIADMLFRTCGANEVGDLTPAVLRDIYDVFKGSFHFAISEALYNSHVKTYGEFVTHGVEDFGTIRGGLIVRDMAFDWVLDRDPTMTQWRTIATEYTAQLHGNLGARKGSVAVFLQYLISNPLFPRDPAAFLKQGNDLQPKFAASNIVTHNNVARFLDWVLNTRYAIEDDQGRPIRISGMRNPLAVVKSKRQYVETSREAMPSRYIRMALQILTEDDWSWAKAQTRNWPHGRTQGGDWISRQKENGDWEEIWSPVRAFALYIKLRMPFRTIQVRTMDDGTYDNNIYDDEQRRMVPNPTLHVSGRASVQRGALQATLDPKSGRTIVQIHLTTNKTADVNKESWQKGYTCPWAPDDVVDVILKLRRWQQEHNPISGPTAWRKLREFKGIKSDAALVGMESCFLFRDPRNRVRRDEPVTDGSISRLWLKLLSELQRRLAAQNMLAQDGSQISLIRTYSPEGYPIAAVYDLHSLRVSLITHLIETREVSPEILMKIVGHLTVIMTLYYIKHGVAYISDCLSAADAKILQNEQRNWIEHTRSQELKNLTRAVAYNCETGLSAYNKAPAASLMVINIGLCPVGGSSCHRGGPKLTVTKSVDDFTPVPGGRSNCAGCRFVITGEPWLHGINAEVNARSFEMSGLSRKRDKLEAAFESLEAERRAQESRVEPFSSYREWERASNDLEEVDSRLGQLGVEWSNLIVLNEQVERIIKDQRREGGTKLGIIFGDAHDVAAALEESTEWELADRLCKASVIYPSLSARGNLPQYANELRVKHYDRMLRKNNLQPRFADMDEETSIYVGNQLSSFLMLQVGRKDTLRLMSGDATFETLIDMVTPSEFRIELTAALDSMVAKTFVLESGPTLVPPKQLVAGS